MRMDLGLSQTLKQIQTLSPQMYMSMEILCMNSLDLEERIETELEGNVALEMTDTQKDESAPDAVSDASAEPSDDPVSEFDSFDRKVEQWDQMSRDDYDAGPRRASSYDGEKDAKLEAMNNTEGKPTSLAEHLEEQLHLLTSSELDDLGVDEDEQELILDLCLEIIFNLDGRGYLLYAIDDIYSGLLQRIDVEEFGHPIEEITLERMQKALRVVQALDPAGVGGLDLKECLLLQLRRDGHAYVIETRIIQEYLDDLANNRIPKIAKALGVQIDDVKMAAETIASLNPLPGRLYGGELPRYVKPDVIVEEVNGVYEVQVTNEYLPRLRVSDYYLELYKQSRKDPELKKFIKKKLESAEWLLAAIRQRQSTLERIAREIVRIQAGFFEHGISRLKPLKMQEVADVVGVHVSTISRAISGKYMQTPQGLLDMKFFFSGGAQKEDGTVEARGSVIQRIKELIDAENKVKPLSDIDIVKKLKESGISISRRTVTKYREAESIPSSRQRRAY